MKLFEFVNRLFEAGSTTVSPCGSTITNKAISDPTGDPSNEVIRLGWTSPDGVPCAVTLTEGGVHNGTLFDDVFTCRDSEGDPFTCQFQIAAEQLTKVACASPSHQRIEVSLDGGMTFMPAPEGVRIVYTRVDIPGEDALGQLHVNATHQGLIYDVWATRDEPLDHNIGSSSIPVQDLVSDLVLDGA